MTNAETKLLLFLEKIREEWDLIPKKSKARYMTSNDYSFPEKRFGTTISPKRLSQWKRECGIEDYYQLENILRILQEEGLIYKYQFKSDTQ